MWIKNLPLELTAWGWGMQDVDNKRSLATRLKHAAVVTRAPQEWSRLARVLTEYESTADFDINRLIVFYALSAHGALGAAMEGDSGSGIVLRRQHTAASGVGDVLYGYTTYGGSLMYSLNESGGEPARLRYYTKATPIPHILGGITATCCLISSSTGVVFRPLCLSRPLWSQSSTTR